MLLRFGIMIVFNRECGINARPYDPHKDVHFWLVEGLQCLPILIFRHDAGAGALPVRSRPSDRGMRERVPSMSGTGLTPQDHSRGRIIECQPVKAGIIGRSISGLGCGTAFLDARVPISMTIFRKARSSRANLRRLKVRQAPLVLGALAVVSLTAAACSSGGGAGNGSATHGNTSTAHHTLHFKVAALNATTGGTNPNGSSQFLQGEPCYGIGGDSDLASGADVVVKNGSGTIIATTTLGDGTANGGVCEFEISVSVPETSFYQIAVGQGHGSTTYSLSQLKADNWNPPELAA